MRMIARAAARAERNRLRAQASQRAAMIRALRNAELQAKADAKQAKADAKEAAKLHVVAQIEEAEDLSRAVQDREKAIGNLLARALAKNPRVDLSSMMKTFAPARFDETQWEMLSAPDRDEFAPKAPGVLARLLPGATRRHERRVMEADRRFDAAHAAYKQRRQHRNDDLPP